MKNITKLFILLSLTLLFNACTCTFSSDDKPEVIESYTLKLTYMNGDKDTVVVKSTIGEPQFHLDNGIGYVYTDLVHDTNYDKITGLRRMDILSVK